MQQLALRASAEQALSKPRPSTVSLWTGSFTSIRDIPDFSDAPRLFPAHADL
jgi:hypothetical protein